VAAAEEEAAVVGGDMFAGNLFGAFAPHPVAGAWGIALRNPAARKPWMAILGHPRDACAAPPAGVLRRCAS
jgi:hypothetical protein